MREQERDRERKAEKESKRERERERERESGAREKERESARERERVSKREREREGKRERRKKERARERERERKSEKERSDSIYAQNQAQPLSVAPKSHFSRVLSQFFWRSVAGAWLPEIGKNPTCDFSNLWSLPAKKWPDHLCVCVCVCVCERGREREHSCVFLHKYTGDLAKKIHMIHVYFVKIMCT